MRLAIFYLTDTVDISTRHNYDQISKLINQSENEKIEVNLYWAINRQIKEPIKEDFNGVNLIRVAPEDIQNYGLFDNQHYKPLWKNNDFFLYYLASKVVADFYIVLEGDYFINDGKYFETIFESIGNIDYVLQNYWETPADSDYYWKNYTNNERLDYKAPYYLTSKNIMGATSKLIDQLTDTRRKQAILTSQGVKIPNDNYFFGMELIKDSCLNGLFLGQIINSMKLEWNDSKYYLDEQVLKFNGTVHPVRSAEQAISSNIQKGSIHVSDFYNNESYLNQILIPAAEKSTKDFNLSNGDVQMLLKNLDTAQKQELLQFLESKELLPKINNIFPTSELFEQTVNQLKNREARILFALNTRYNGSQFPEEVNFRNLALFKKVTLSSTFKESAGELATDGNFNPNKYTDGGFHTNWEVEPSAILDLGNTQSISSLALYHRKGYFNRTRSLKIFTSIDGKIWDIVDSDLVLNINWSDLKHESQRSSTGYVYRLNIPLSKRNVRYVKVVNVTSGKNPLHLNQIEVF